MVDRLSLVPRLRPGVEIQVIDDDVLVLAGDDLSRLTGYPARAIRSMDGIRGVRAVADLVGTDLDSVVETIDHLVAQGILELVDDGPEPRYRRPDHVGVSEDRDLLVLLDLRTGDRPVLSSPAAEIWRLLVATGSLTATVAELQVDFPDAPSLAEDTAGFVAELVAKGLLERMP